jgi:hypothetical protein
MTAPLPGRRVYDQDMSNDAVDLVHTEPALLRYLTEHRDLVDGREND